MKFTEKIRTKESYFEKIQVKSDSFVNSSNISINSFESFLKEKHKISLDDMINEILLLDEEKRIDAICDVTQIWINKLHKNKRSPKTIRDYFSFLRENPI